MNMIIDGHFLWTPNFWENHGTKYKVFFCKPWCQQLSTCCSQNHGDHQWRWSKPPSFTRPKHGSALSISPQAQEWSSPSMRAPQLKKSIHLTVVFGPNTTFLLNGTMIIDATWCKKQNDIANWLRGFFYIFFLGNVWKSVFVSSPSWEDTLGSENKWALSEEHPPDLPRNLFFVK